MGRSAVLSGKPNPHLSQNWRNSSNLERPICNHGLYSLLAAQETVLDSATLLKDQGLYVQYVLYSKVLEGGKKY